MELITVPEAARRTGYGQEHIRKLAREGKVRAERFGRDWAIWAEDIEAWPRRGRGRPKKVAAR